MQFKRVKRNISGVLLLDKPLGITSNAALQAAKRLYSAAKAGHTGTLDPLATGLLPICFGEATKFAQFPTDADKHYDATITLGVRTDTGDKEGRVISESPVAVSAARLETALARFRGQGTQIPPMYSALKVQGQALYKYAREGIKLERAPRAVNFHHIVLHQFDSSSFTISVTCSKGAYIRVLAEDIGEALGCGAILSALRRTGVGGFSLADAVTLGVLESFTPSQRDAQLLRCDTLVAHLPEAHLDAVDAAHLRLGRAIPRPELEVQGNYKVYDEKQVFMGIAWLNEEKLLAPKRLVVSEASRVLA